MDSAMVTNDRNPLWTHSSQIPKYLFSQNYSHLFRSVLLFSSVSSLCLLYLCRSVGYCSGQPVHWPLETCQLPHMFQVWKCFAAPCVCMLLASRVLRHEPSLTRTNRAGATTGTTSSPCLCLLAAVFTLWGAVQPFIFLLGSTFPSRVGIEVLWRCFPPKGQSRGDNPFS